MIPGRNSNASGAGAPASTINMAITSARAANTPATPRGLPAPSFPGLRPQLNSMQLDNSQQSGDLSVGGDGGCHMSRRRKALEDHSLSALTWLFTGLVVVAAIAGLLSEVAR